MWSFQKARAFVRKLKLKNREEWKLYCRNNLKGYNRMPLEIPKSPQPNGNKSIYNKEWKGWGDWLGTNFEYWDFKKARKFVQKLNLKSSAEWHLYCQNKHKKFKIKPLELPGHPNRIYKDEWKGMGDWLGTGKLAQGNWRPFEEARAYVQ